MSEFGRTPKINANEGRDHYPKAWNAVLAGGGVRSGQAYGATDATGENVVDKPVLTADYFATIAALLGMSPSKTFMTPIGRPISITGKGTPIKELIARKRALNKTNAGQAKAFSPALFVSALFDALQCRGKIMMPPQETSP